MLFVYIGTYTEPILFGTGKVMEGKGEGIYVYRMDRSTGSLRFERLVAGIPNPSYLALAPKQQRLYAVNELKEYEGHTTGTVSSFRIDSSTGNLTFLSTKPTQGTDPCHVTVTESGRCVFVANFMSGSVCVFPVMEDGRLGDAAEFIQHAGSSAHPQRQTGPHAHSVILDETGGRIFVPDLGLDKLMIYAFDSQSGKLMPHTIPWFQTKPGAGPRQLAFHPAGRHAYLINELDSTIIVLDYDRGQGTFREIQTVSTLPEGYNGQSTGADVHVSPSGKFLYGSNRGHDSIVTYRIDETSGRLSYLDHVATGGRTPRNFAIDPEGRFLLVANQDSDTIVLFHLDPHSGLPQPTGQVKEVPTPVCVKMAVLER